MAAGVLYAEAPLGPLLGPMMILPGTLESLAPGHADLHLTTGTCQQALVVEAALLHPPMAAAATAAAGAGVTAGHAAAGTQHVAVIRAQQEASGAPAGL